MHHDVVPSSVTSKRQKAARLLLVVSCAIAAATVAAVRLRGTSEVANLAAYPDPSGVVQTFTKNGNLDISNPFFATNLGTNGRSCVSCHQAGDGWSVTPEHVQARFNFSQGLDPIFRTVDGANCPSADVSTVSARQSAYSMLLTKGLIRVSIGVPQNADFNVIGINDPYDCRENNTAGLALFRRPLPAVNLPFLTTVMWDGRESLPGKTLTEDLADQATGAIGGHAQGTSVPSGKTIQQIVDFEFKNFTAQGSDNSAGYLGAQNASGGPTPLSAQKFYAGINDALGADPTGAPFNPVAFTMYSNWENLSSASSDQASAARASVARGEKLFNTFPITISGVAGLNDKPGVPASFVGNCTTCHDSPNVGNHSVPLAINIGIADYPALPALDTSGLPVYTIQCENKTVQTTDPARALITGKCADIGKTKGPILRGLAARAPYFHNGSAATLMDAVNFYDQRFHLNLTDQQKHDLAAFLSAL
jgi:cytochrome c peroxidase